MFYDNADPSAEILGDTFEIAIGMMTLAIRTPELCGNPRVSLECTPQRPNPRVSLECPTAECPRSAQLQSLLKCPTPESPAEPNPRLSRQSVPGVPNRRVSLPREGGDVRSTICFNLFVCLSFYLHM